MGVVDIDVRTPYRRIVRRPIARWAVDGKWHRSTIDNCTGAAPIGSGVDLLVDLAHPQAAVAANRHDSDRELASAVVLAAAGTAVVGLSLTVF
jgi:hypothetical protein